jgi:hypothetical protein
VHGDAVGKVPATGLNPKKQMKMARSIAVQRLRISDHPRKRKKIR